MRFSSFIAACCLAAASLATAAVAEPCTTQSQMQPLERAALSQAAVDMATLVSAGNADGVRALTMPQFANDFGGIAGAIRTAAPHLQGASFVPESLWILDASASKPGADGSPGDVQFFCALNKGASQTSFLIPALPAGRYALAVLNTAGTAEPWQVALLLRQGADGKWQLGGLFPRATTVGGHDGLWYWRAGRDYATKKQAWNAFVSFSAAETLLRPVSFVSSTHLELLESERSRSAPPALSSGIGPEAPLVIAPARGSEVRVTSLGAQASPDKAGVDVVAHVHAEDVLTDPVALRARNAAAARALVAAYPELRSAFHGVWIVTELPGGTNYTSEEAMMSL